MKIIIAPAKTMRIESDLLAAATDPLFPDETRCLKEAVQALTYPQAKALWGCNDKLAELNYERFRRMDGEPALTPAVLAYEGLVYLHMGARVMSEDALAYLDGHLRILSGFYGVIRPFDRVVPYRLEMQARLAVGDCRDLYDFWGDKLYRAVSDESHIIINLASKEYSRAIEEYLQPGDRFITICFGEMVSGKIKQKATPAKMARGEMVRFMAERRVSRAEELRDFAALGFSFCEERSDENTYIFLR